MTQVTPTTVPSGIPAPPVITPGPATTISPIGLTAGQTPNEDIAAPGGTQNIYGRPFNSNPYMPGAELNPGSGTQDQIVALQDKLVQAGLLTPTQVRAGLWDAKSQDAYKIVLAFANQYGMNAQDALTVLLNSPQASKTLAPGQLTNPADIAQSVSGAPVGSEDTAQRMLGMDLPPGEVKDFIKQYQAQETAARAAYKKAHLTGGETYQGPASVDAAAQQYIKEHNLRQAVAYGTAARMFEFFGMLKGP